MNKKSSFPPSTKRVGGAAWFSPRTFLIVAAILTTGSIAFLFVTAPAPERKSARQVESTDSSAGDAFQSNSSTSSPWLDELEDDAAETASLSPGREFSEEVMDHVSRFEIPTVKEVIERLHALGDYSGIGAFNPPGTRPAMIGLAVPEDFVLPEGYVRHHQATDDGQRIEAILMFAPGYDHRDAYNQPIPVPEDRIVPPELAPRGLPLRRIVLPKPVGPDGFEP
jgi:hypothetical protein